MGKVTNKGLATLISARIKEILTLSGLTITGLAKFAGIGESAIRSYYSRTIPISVETVSKICESLSIVLKDFFDFDKTLSIGTAALPELENFKTKLLQESMNYSQEEETEFVQLPTSTGLKREREYIAYIVKYTDYFDAAKTVAMMLVDFANEYDLELESGRLYELLKKHVDNGTIEKIPTPRVNNDNSVSTKKIFLYKKKS
ncbi:helix-turn-helix domain-containing protein [Sphingobacterium detergens]|uniref:HTH cro/C1-type domain-containing protein n=1 Tax=Sphingobacterium detergens TaxID=1145106 RepID=A0A420B6L1_SPHD1|nr:helix-turn-helix transcriptional regulator [Sphingobacterium detergens]RKE52299.1 hypothetical protein DFQ12_2533 [Sphingobacterium detergens]